VLINTSFNTRGEPVVNNAAEALSAAQASQHYAAK